MDVQDALELLGPSFAHPTVRTYAVARLKQALDEVFFVIWKITFFNYCNLHSIKLVSVGSSFIPSATRSSIKIRKL